MDNEKVTEKPVLPTPVDFEVVAVVEEKKPVKKVEPVKPMYKLNLYRANGHHRTDISSAIIYEVSKNWGDLLRVIPGNRWSTLEEIIQLVWEWEKKQYRRPFSRTRKQIEDGIADLTRKQIVQVK